MAVFLKLALALAPTALASVKQPAEMKYTFTIDTISGIDTKKLGLPDLIAGKLPQLVGFRKRVWCEKKGENEVEQTEVPFNGDGGSVDAKMCERAFVTFENSMGIVILFEIGIFKGQVVAGEGSKKNLSHLMFLGIKNAGEGSFPLESDMVDVHKDGRPWYNVYVVADTLNNLGIEIYADDETSLRALNIVKVEKKVADSAQIMEISAKDVDHFVFRARHETKVKIGNFLFVLGDSGYGTYIKEVARMNANNKPQFAEIEGALIYSVCIGFPRAASFASFQKAQGFWRPWLLIPIVLVLAAASVAWFFGPIGGGSEPEESQHLSSRLSSSSIEGGQIEIEASL